MTDSSTLPSWARVGARVVCIKRGPWETVIGVDAGAPKPHFGSVHSITKARIYAGHAVIQLAGCANQWFVTEAFRPAVEPKSEAEDLAVFRKLLHTNQPVDA